MAYKVVHEDGKDIFSCRMYESDAKIYYRVEEWVEPQVGLALVFVHLSAAKEFCRRYRSPSDVIYRCQTRGLEKVDLLLLAVYDVAKFWEESILLGSAAPNVTPAPPGTYGAKAVKLTKRLGMAHDLSFH